MNNYKEFQFNGSKNNSSSKNLFGSKIKLSNSIHNFKDNWDNIKFFNGKWNSLSNRQENSKENIFIKKMYNENAYIRDKIIKDKNIKESATLPELNQKNYKNNKMIKSNIYENNNIKKISTYKSKTIFDGNLNLFRTKSVSPNKKMININNNDVNKINKNNFNININNTPSTSAYTNSTKKINSNKSNNVTDDLSKYRLGLLSAGSSSYNNVIIPMLSLRRPASNFNFGGDKIWNNMVTPNINNKNDVKEKIEYENSLKENEESVIFKNNKNNLNGFFDMNKNLHNSHKYKEKLSESENSNLLYQNMQKLMPKFHKIKIEKGMMDTKIANSLGKKLFINFYNQNNKVNKYSLMFNNNNERNNNINKNNV